MRVSRPGGYLASGITQPFWGVLALLVVAGFSAASIGAVAALYLLRSLVALLFSRVYVQDTILPRYLWLLPLRDMLYSGTWALSFLGRRVCWRGTRYDLLPGGRIVRLG
jgi:ceramide glucosyltransferase